MFNKKNDPLIESVKGVMEQNELHRRVEAAVNEHFGIESRSALPHELHAEYDAVLAEAKKCSIEEGEVIDLAAKRKEKAKKKEEESDEEKKDRFFKALTGKAPTKEQKEAFKKMKMRDDDELNEEKKNGAKYKKNIHKQTGDKIKGYKEKDDGKSITRQWTVERPKKKKKLEESEDKPDSPEHHRAMAIRAHKAMKAGDKSEITANKKKRHEKVYKEMTGSKIKYPDSMNEENDEGSTPRNAKERALAKLHGNPKKITHGDVLKGRGVVEEEKATESQKNKVGKVMGEFKRGKLHSGSKKGPVVKNKEQAIAIALNQAGLSKKKLEEEMDIDIIMEEIRSNLLEELNYVYENYDEASFADYVNSLTEEQLEILGLMEVNNPNASSPLAKPAGMNAPAPRPTVRSNPRTGPMTPSPTAADKLKSLGDKPDRMDGTSIDRTAGSAPGSAAYRSAANTPTYKSPQQKSAERATPTMSGGSGSVSPTGPSGGGISTERGAGMSRQQLMKRSDNPQAMYRQSGKSGTSASASQRAGASSPAPARTQQTVMGGAGQSGAAPKGGGIGTLAGSGAKSMSQQRRMMDNPAALRKQPIREEEEAPVQIKESFEQFLRNRFLRG